MLPIYTDTHIYTFVSVEELIQGLIKNLPPPSKVDSASRWFGDLPAQPTSGGFKRVIYSKNYIITSPQELKMLLSGGVCHPWRQLRAGVGHRLFTDLILRKITMDCW